MKISRGKYTYEVNTFEHERFWEHIASGHWEEDTFNLLDHYVKESDIVMDVGSWAGPLSLYLAHIAKQVYALEPDPGIFHQLENNIALNPKLASRVQADKLALFHKSTRHRLYAREAYSQSSTSLLERSYDRLSSEFCQTITLEEYAEKYGIERLDFIKMDIEGGEFEVLPHLGPSLEKLGKPSLLVSFHYYQLKENVIRRRFPSARFSRYIYKMARYSPLPFFKREMRRRIQACLKVLGSYHYVYTVKGESIPITMLLEDDIWKREDSFIFTNQKW
jgi:FkbM family methyltransferase